MNPRRRLPAEWEPHQATWFSWPHNRETWPEQLTSATAALVPAVQSLGEGETVHINVLDAAHREQVRAQVGDSANIILHILPTNDAWCRDHGAIFIQEQTAHGWELVATHWQYNAWGEKYPPWERDQRVGAQMAAILAVPCRTLAMVLEGGAIESNGAGILLASQDCLLHPRRNPGLTTADWEGVFRDYLGAQRVLWLNAEIQGDDTDGHVDVTTRFVGSDTLVVAVETNPDDGNYPSLQANWERLQALAPVLGLRLIPLPMPQPVIHAGQRLPASYANFYIGNRVVLLPTFNDPQDGVALGILQKLFPERRVVGIDSRAIIEGLGGLHCLTQPVPAI
ncbi:agmatine deiminase [Gloeomargarita lithophora Alchichica-D10]|uniref:Agmatine deiminase n=1 Tax=Gloeomargarita lithophora Alchichica-D10 TaxID=1188229 RepID=A0A1J0AD19_9CYAN|nr:agmatine deiminase family protein [Gloeomargarita lithophora]APB33829.1 agmatine deiminase [Gloeomargarita lithophora Alchichica-D10]